MDNRVMSEKTYVNWLYHVPGLGRKKMSVILSQGLSAMEICHMPDKQLASFLQERCGFTEKQTGATASYFRTFRKMSTPENLMEKLYQKQILFLLPDDPEFPEKLKQIPDAPFALYMMGSRDAARRVSQKSVAIIGARECSEYGRYVAEQLGRRCAQHGFSVVSGMAYGVDGISQWAAASEGASVAAVLGSGVDVCYPPSNRKLYDALKQSGCIFSEYIPGTEPKPTNFPPRNRIISGMADALIVVEAKEKSGTLITVDMALEQGKEVYVVPGRINDPMSKGCNRLIRQGAAVMCDVDEVLGEILCGGLHNMSRSETKLHSEVLCMKEKNPYPTDSLRHAIYRALDMQPRSVQQIYESPVWSNAGVAKPTVKMLQTELFYMQMEGAVWESNGRFGIT